MFRVQNFKKGCGWIPLHIHTQHFINFIQHKNGVGSTCLFQTLDDASRHGADVGLAVSADFGLITQATEGDTDILALQGVGDGVPQRGFTDTGRPYQTEYRSLHVLFQLQDGNVLDDAFLHLLKTVMVAVEHLAGVFQIKIVHGILFPRQIHQ